MRGGSGILAAAVGALWVAVYVATQVATRPALATSWTVAIGVALSIVLILGYPSALRGPRLGRRAAYASLRQPTGSGTIAMMGRSIPLRHGLTTDAARRTARLLLPILGGDAVAITDTDKVLAFVGPGADHHGTHSALVTRATQKVLASGRTLVVRGQSQLGCPDDGCRLHSAVIAPLTVGERVAGTLKVYRLTREPPPRELV